jgi:hypothetical protein
MVGEKYSVHAILHSEFSKRKRTLKGKSSSKTSSNEKGTMTRERAMADFKGAVARR